VCVLFCLRMVLLFLCVSVITSRILFLESLSIRIRLSPGSLVFTIGKNLEVLGLLSEQGEEPLSGSSPTLKRWPRWLDINVVGVLFAPSWLPRHDIC